MRTIRYQPRFFGCDNTMHSWRLHQSGRSPILSLKLGHRLPRTRPFANNSGATVPRYRSANSTLVNRSILPTKDRLLRTNLNSYQSIVCKIKTKTNSPSPHGWPAPNEPQLGQTFAIKHESKAFFLNAKAVQKYKYSTVQGALWQTHDKGSANANTIHCRLHFGKMLIL